MASRRIIDLVVEEGIGTLIIGKNSLWKQRVELDKKHNQEFVQIPHARFIDLKVPISCDADATTEQEMRALFLLLPRQWLISWMSLKEMSCVSLSGDLYERIGVWPKRCACAWLCSQLIDLALGENFLWFCILVRN